MINVLSKIAKLIRKEQSILDNEKDFLTSLKSSEFQVVDYLKEKLKPLYINVCGEYSGNLFELIDNKKLEGWCWQTTQTCALFLEDNDYIERGYIRLNDVQRNYHHSWLSFEYDNIEYVFDPCLDYLCRKELYYKYFEPTLQSKISAKSVKDAIYETIQQKKEVEHSWLWDKISQEQRERLGKETIVNGTNDVTSPIFRTTIGYTSKLSNDNIEERIAHYYMSGMI